MKILIQVSNDNIDQSDAIISVDQHNEDGNKDSNWCKVFFCKEGNTIESSQRLII